MNETELTQTLDDLIEFKSKFVLPEDHQPAMRVPKGGSSCSNCRFLGADKCSCNNKHFQRWHGSRWLPYPADCFCSDWYECD